MNNINKDIKITTQGGVVYTSSGAGEVLNAYICTPMALGYMFAFFFNLPCMAIVAAANTELHSSKWTLRVTLYYLITALLIGGAAYYVGLLIF